MRLKSEKSNVENENFALRQEIDSKIKEVKNNYDLYKAQRAEHESFLKQVIIFEPFILNLFLRQSEKALKEHSQFSYIKSSLEAENFALREKNELLMREIDEMCQY